jgi:anaerobic selenocysteine-containing dehydrogenase
MVTDYPVIANAYPPNVMPEEILSNNPDKLRAVIVSTSNPLRSYADTSAYEEAFKELDLLVTVDPSMTETAALSHYVLPARSAYESWDGSPKEGYPKTFMQFRHPVLEPEGESLEGGEIFLRIADRLGMIPEIPQSLYQAADTGDRSAFGTAFMAYLQSDPKAGSGLPFVLGKTLGRKLGSVHLGAMWGTLQNLSPNFHELAERAGFHPGPALGEEIFQAILEHPEGFWMGAADVETWDHFKALATEDRCIHLDIPKMTEWLEEIDPEREEENLKLGETNDPFIMSSGRHWDVNANSQMRDPAWNKGKRDCTVTMHPADAEKYGFSDGQMVKVKTDAGEETIELEITKMTRPGYIVIPHGFGLVYQGKAHGANANRLAKNTHRDRLAGTPYHRYIRCRVEAAVGTSVNK